MADEFDQGLATLWEVLWHQSGTPTRIVRWENDIRVRIFGVNAGRPPRAHAEGPARGRGRSRRAS